MNYVYAFLMVYVTSKFCNREKFVIKQIFYFHLKIG